MVMKLEELRKLAQEILDKYCGVRAEETDYGPSSLIYYENGIQKEALKGSKDYAEIMSAIRGR